MTDFDWLDPTDESELETARQLKRPLLHYRREHRREFVNGLKKQALNELIPELPPPDVDLYVVGNGAGAEVKHGINPLAFDFGTFIPHIVERLGNQACIAYISTWTMNRTHVKSLIEMLDDGRLAQLTVCTDPYFKRREAAICAELIDGLQRHNQRFIAFKNHCKIIAIAAPEFVASHSSAIADLSPQSGRMQGDIDPLRGRIHGRTCVITGSANMSAQPRCESYVLTTAPDVYQFFVSDFFEAMYAKGN